MRLTRKLLIFYIIALVFLILLAIIGGFTFQAITSILVVLYLVVFTYIKDKKEDN